MDFYSDTILSPNKAVRYRITREKLLQILNVSEETVKDGLTVNDVVPFFEKFKLQLKLFNEVRKLRKSFITKILKFFKQNGLGIIRFTEPFTTLIEEEGMLGDYTLQTYYADTMDLNGIITGKMNTGDEASWHLQSLSCSEVAYILDELEANKYTVVEDMNGL
jgi:hypothetical protein